MGDLPMCLIGTELGAFAPFLRPKKAHCVTNGQSWQLLVSAFILAQAQECPQAIDPRLVGFALS